MKQYRIFYVFRGRHAHYELNAFSLNEMTFKIYLSERLRYFNQFDLRDLEISSVLINGKDEHDAVQNFIGWYNDILGPQTPIDDTYEIVSVSTENEEDVTAYTEAEADMASYYLQYAEQDIYITETLHSLDCIIRMISYGLIGDDYPELYSVVMFFKWYIDLMALLDDIVYDINDNQLEAVKRSLREYRIDSDIKIDKVCSKLNSDVSVIRNEVVSLRLSMEDLYS